MKRTERIVLAAVLTVFFLGACGVAKPEDGFALNGTVEKESVEKELSDMLQRSFVLGGITVTDSDGLYERKTGTQLTDAVEKLLAEKYGQEFCCEQYLYREEYSLLADFSAYPKADPELVFALDVTGEDTLRIWWDHYYNELYRDEIEEYLYPAVAQYGIDRDQFYAEVYDMVTTPQISEKTFYQRTMGIYLSVSEEVSEELHDKMPEIAPQIYDKTRSEEGFWIYVCREGMEGAKDFSYDRVWRGYRVEYHSNGLLDISCQAKTGGKAQRWTVPVLKAAGENPEGEKESLKELSNSYVKEPAEEDILTDRDSGIQYVKNQILVSCLLGIPKEIMEELAEYAGADIVGYIELTCDYQLEFREEKSYSELEQMAEYFEGYPFVDCASLNYATPIELN